MDTLNERMPDNMHESFESSAHTRCDACQAQAYTLAVHETMPSELMFCMHHRKKHSDALLEMGWTLIDDYGAIEQFMPAEAVPV